VKKSGGGRGVWKEKDDTWDYICEYFTVLRHDFPGMADVERKKQLL
jgi:hypothetical protein